MILARPVVPIGAHVRRRVSGVLAESFASSEIAAEPRRAAHVVSDDWDYP